MIGMVEFHSFEKLFKFIGNKAMYERIVFFMCLCGSLIAFMKDEILAEDAPLHGRAMLELRLQPFKNEKVDKEVFECFIEKAYYIKGKNPLLRMFSLALGR